MAPIREGAMNHPKAAVVCYALAVGFILVVAFHSSDKTRATTQIQAQAASNTSARPF
jgi:hypothetical protein